MPFYYKNRTHASTSRPSGYDIENSHVKNSVTKPSQEETPEPSYKFQAEISGLRNTITVEVPTLGPNNAANYWKWQNTFNKARKTCNWDEKQSLTVLHLLIHEEYYKIVEKEPSLDASLDAMKNYFYPREHMNLYIRKVKEVQYRKSRIARDYVLELDRAMEHVNMCLGPDEQLSSRERYSYFLEGLTREARERLIMYRVRSIPDAVQLLTEFESMEEEFGRKEHQKMPKSMYKETTKTKYCSIHKTHSHSNEECRSNLPRRDIPGKGEPRTKFPNWERKTSDKTMIINDAGTPIDRIPIEVEIAKYTCQGILDTGAYRTLISQELLAKLPDVKETTLAEEKRFTIANGDQITAKKVVDVVMSLKEFGEERYKTECYVVDKLPEEVILGLEFMHRNKVKIDFDEMNMAVNGRFKALNKGILEQISIPDKIIMEKSQCYRTIEEKVNDMLAEMAEDSNDMGKFPGTKHEICLENETPIANKPYKIPHKILPSVEEEVGKLLEKGVIRKSDSPYASPAFPILKRTGDVRIVVDYRKLNAITRKNQHPIPTIWEQLKDLEGAQQFSQIDLNSGYYQILMRPEDVAKTAFILPFGHFEFLRMPFGLAGAPRTFQRIMNDIFGSLAFVKVFLDDILVYSKDKEEHVEHLKEVFDRLKENGLQINRKKSTILAEQVEYLGMIISKAGIKASPRHTEMLGKIQSPRNRRHILQVVGLINWFRPFIQNLSTKIANITEMTRKDVRFEWSDEREKELREVIQEIQKGVQLSHPDFTKRFYLSTDASNTGIGAVLTQEGRIIGFYSKRLTAAQERYTTTEKEALAIVLALNHFKSIIFLYPITILTDHSNLKFLGRSDQQRVQRWRLIIDEFHPEIRYVKGDENQCADFLSRINYLHDEDPDEYPLENERVARHQQGDKEISHIISEIQNGREDDKYNLVTAGKEQILITKKQQIIIPRSLQKHVFHWMHNYLVHPGYMKLYHTLKELVYWRNMKKDISSYTRNCRICSCYKDSEKKYGIMQADLTFNTPWKTIAVDIYGPLEPLEEEEESDHGAKTYVVSMIDCSTRWPELVATEDISAAHVSGIIDRAWMCRYPRPEVIISDQGPQFMSKEFREVMINYGIKHKTTTTANPEGNGIVERMHATLGNALRCHPYRSPKHAIDNIAWAMRVSYHQALGCTPGEIVFGRNMLEPEMERNVSELKARYIVRKRKQANKDLERCNRNRKKVSYAGLNVFIKVPNPSKLGIRWKGPYKVIEDDKENNTCLVDLNGKPKRVNYRRLKPSQEEESVVTLTSD